MDIVRISSKRAGTLFAAGLLLFATMLPALASAATVTARSVGLSSSTAGASGVTYDVSFTAATDATGALMLDFCTTPGVGTTCTAPTGMTIGTIGTSSAHTVTEAANNSVKVVLSASVDDGDPVDFDITGITNTSTVGPMYARIVTYTDDTALTAQYQDAETLGTYKDDGVVAISITDGFSVDGVVAETMTFCVAASTDTINSGCTGTLTSPDISLGTNGVLDEQLSEGTIKTQISTNAVGGAVVYLKSDAAGCGGLLRDGTGTAAERCGISPITTPGSISDGAALFGLKLANLGGTTGTTVAAGQYGTTNYYLGYDSDDQSEGVTSPYGDPVFNTGGSPIADGTANLTFGANMSATTPAGNYSANFSLVATGTF